jgi:DNA-binding LacI/PurR family transcriptional regulator
VDEALSIEGDYSELSGMEAARQFLSHSVTAIFATSAMLAVGVLKAVRE